MATIMRQSHHMTRPRFVVQKVCIGLGIFLIALGIIGLVQPGFIGMHLSLLHNLIHLISGTLALWCGYSDDPKKAYGFTMGFGIVFALLGLAGLFLGEPGYPGVGHMEADENLFRLIPNSLEFGTMDHIVHLIVSIISLTAAYRHIKRRDDEGRITVEAQGRVHRGQ